MAGMGKGSEEEGKEKEGQEMEMRGLTRDR